MWSVATGERAAAARRWCARRSERLRAGGFRSRPISRAASGGARRGSRSVRLERPSRPGTPTAPARTVKARGCGPRCARRAGRSAPGGSSSRRVRPTRPVSRRRGGPSSSARGTSFPGRPAGRSDPSAAGEGRRSQPQRSGEPVARNICLPALLARGRTSGAAVAHREHLPLQRRGVGGLGVLHSLGSRPASMAAERAWPCGVTCAPATPSSPTRRSRRRASLGPRGRSPSCRWHSRLEWPGLAMNAAGDALVWLRLPSRRLRVAFYSGGRFCPFETLPASIDQFAIGPRGDVVAAGGSPNVHATVRSARITVHGAAHHRQPQREPRLGGRSYVGGRGREGESGHRVAAQHVAGRRARRASCRSPPTPPPAASHNGHARGCRSHSRVTGPRTPATHAPRMPRKRHAVR